ncbi:ATP-grasp domain-containing protein [Corticicoccus populi]|uniref:ATP-grasp domain-containing protein n=1 Tax=Corticicoccus populi TaxID=1812821 RepID=A0ABW5WUB3_9STAP
MNVSDLEYILSKNPYDKNVYSNDIIFHLPNIHLNFLQNNDIKYVFQPAAKRYMRAIDILRHDESVITTIKPPRYSTNDSFSHSLVRDKLKTEGYLKRFNINTPESQIYNKEEVERAKELSFKDSNHSVVIKPLYGTLGKGVRVNVREDRFEYNWEVAANSSTNKNEIIVQKFLEGFEARATIIEGTLLSITVRIPPYVVGDGQNSIEDLIAKKNESRKVCGFLRNYPIKKSETMKEYLNSIEKSMFYIPKSDEKVLLGSVSNLSNGGELFNITESVSNDIKELALDALASFPGLYTGGLDIIMKSFDDKEAVILEVNSFPVIAIAAYPTYGPKTDPSKAYIESVIAMDQYVNTSRFNYTIENEKQYIKNYLSFMNRKKRQVNRNYKVLLEGLDNSFND